jgi:hypothetical protein
MEFEKYCSNVTIQDVHGSSLPAEALAQAGVPSGHGALVRIHKKGAKEMKVKRKVIMVLVMLGVGLAMVMPGVSQEKPADNMQIVLEKVRADKKLLVAENMQLTEAEAKAFWPVYDQYQDELFLLRTRTLKLINDFADAYEKMSNETAKKLMDEFITIENLGPKLRQAYLPKFRKVLPEVKVVRYYQIENKIQAALFYEFAANIPLMKTGK